MKKNNNKGFTLAELLIVVAIIAVLVAIAIPIFTSQLEKARDATSVANMRSAYAEAQIAFLTQDNVGANVKYTKGTADDAATVEVGNVIIKTEQANEWSDVAGDLPWNVGATGVTPEDPGTSAVKTMVFTYAGGELTTVAFK